MAGFSGGDRWGGGGGRAGGGGGDPFTTQVYGAGGVEKSPFETGVLTGAEFRSSDSDEVQHIARAYATSRSGDGFVHAEEGKYQLQSTGLPDEKLRQIWDMSDADHDGRLSLREFVCAMHLAVEAKHRKLPDDFDHRSLERLVHSVERAVSLGASDWSRAEARHGRSNGFAPGSSGHDSNGRRSSEDRGWLGFDAPGELGRRGRDPAPRPQAPGSQRPYGTSTQNVQPGSGKIEPPPGAGLGQLASVFEVIARLDATGELRRLSQEVIQERKNLEQHLARRRDIELKLQQSRGQLEAFREERRTVDTESSAAQRHAAHLQDELGFVEREVKDAETDLNSLRDSADMSKSQRHTPAPYGNSDEERRDVLSKVRAEKELLQHDQQTIQDLRVRLENVFKDKLQAQALQQSLLEKQRQTEQDRGLMLTAIEAERGRLSAMRAERIRMWEERSGLEREMTNILQERWLAEHRAPARGGKDARDGMGAQIGVPAEQDFRSAPGALGQRNSMPSNGGAPMRDSKGLRN